MGPHLRLRRDHALDSALVAAHAATLSGLSPGLTYHYRVLSRDAAGNPATSPDFGFSTATGADTAPPAISSVQAGSMTTSGATVS